jgi:flagellar protein FlaG
LIDSGVPIGPLDAAVFRPRAERTPAPAGTGADFGVTLSRELEGPPPELRVQVRDASRRWEELRAMDRELHFEQDPQSGRIVVEVRDLEGRLIRTVPPSTALEIAAGAPLP